MTHVDNGAIAARLRTLIGSRTLTEAAAQLAVSEVALRFSVDPEAPYPAIEVLVGAALFFAVDPTWILPAEYDTATHRVVLDGQTDDVGRAIQLGCRQSCARPRRGAGRRARGRALAEYDLSAHRAIERVVGREGS